MVDFTGEIVYNSVSEKCLRPIIANKAVFLFPNLILSRAMLRAKGFAIGRQLPLAMGLKPPFARSIAFFIPWTGDGGAMREVAKKWGPGYVYMMHAVGTTFYKIGHATNVERRWYGIDSACPLPVVIIHKTYVDMQTEAEAYWHRIFRSLRVKGEWFNLTEGHVQLFKAVKDPNPHMFGYEIFYLNKELVNSLEGIG